MFALLGIWTLLSCLLRAAQAFSFTFNNAPTQCAPLTLQVVGTGHPPYNLVLSNPNDTAQPLFNYFQFDSQSFDIPALQWAEGQSFVAILSDSSGVGTGGTGNVMPVLGSKNSSCLTGDIPQQAFQGHVNASQFIQCGRFTVTSNDNIGPLTAWVIVPGGTTIGIPVAGWQVDIRAGTEVMFAMGDNRGPVAGGGGPLQSVVDSGDKSCLGANSPTVTPPPAAGAVAPAQTSGIPTPVPLPQATVTVLSYVCERVPWQATDSLAR
jgi:hypothetical protein